MLVCIHSDELFLQSVVSNQESTTMKSRQTILCDWTYLWVFWIKNWKKSFWLSGCNVEHWLSASSESAGFSWWSIKSECKPLVAVSPLALAIGNLNLAMEKNWELLDFGGSFFSSGFIVAVQQKPRDVEFVGWRPCCHFVSVTGAGVKCLGWFFVSLVNLARMSHKMVITFVMW